MGTGPSRASRHETSLNARGPQTNAAAVLEEIPNIVQKGPESGKTGPPSDSAKKSAFTTQIPQQQEASFELPVRGTIPKWLKGDLIRNGPGFYAPEARHMFDGYAMLVKFSFENGNVKTQQRIIQTAVYKAFKETGQMQYAEFGTSVGLLKSLYYLAKSALGSGPGITDNSNVNTVGIPGGKEILSMTEVASGSYRIAKDNLETLSRVTHSDEVKGDLTTAHPVVYPDGSIYNLFTDMGKGRCVAKIDAKTQNRTLVANVPTNNPLSPTWVHDLPGSENYIIVPDTPVHFTLKGLLQREAKYFSFEWDNKVQPTRFHLVPKNGGPVKTVEADFDYFAFHYANAFESEDGKTIYVDCPIFKDPQLVNGLSLENVRSGQHSIAETSSTYSRISIPLDGGRATLKTLVPPDQCLYIELQRINPHYKFRDYQYVYGVTSRLPTAYGNAISKLDIKNGTSKQWFEPGCITTEPLMIPKPGSEDEDEGVVTSLVNGADGKNFLLIMDAKSFEEIARAELPYGIAYGFHNQFYH